MCRLIDLPKINYLFIKGTGNTFPQIQYNYFVFIGISGFCLSLTINLKSERNK
jgi:hypothetical protein